jgi:succinyl-diaminopimelate desuccinylase
LGHNAVHAALPLLARVAAVPQRSVTFPDYPDLRYEEVLNVTTIEGGVARNTIPPQLMFNANFRFAPDRTSEQARQTILDLVGEDGSVSFQDVSPSGAVPQNDPHCNRLIQLSGRPPRAKQAWTDVGRFTEWGIPSVSFGPGIPEQAHQRGEYASVEAMVESYAMFTQFLTGQGSSR